MWTRDLLWLREGVVFIGKDIFSGQGFSCEEPRCLLYNSFLVLMKNGALLEFQASMLAGTDVTDSQALAHWRPSCCPLWVVLSFLPQK
jgi:hypothetical protein